jgi:ribA/ribD-fused uncharacterized protein
MSAAGGGGAGPPPGSPPPPPPADFLTSLAAAPAPPAVPMYYLNARAAHVIAALDLAALRPYVPHLPGWLPHAVVARALGLPVHGIDAAAAARGPYAWATEFENVHATWMFEEPEFEYEGVVWRGPEQLFQAHKAGDPGTPAFAAAAPGFARSEDDAAWGRGQTLPLRPDWPAIREGVMRKTLRLKFTAPGAAGDALRAVLADTGAAPLVSVKADAFWGIGVEGTGANRLGDLIAALRDELRADGVLPPLPARAAGGGGAGGGGGGGGGGGSGIGGGV